MTYFYVPLSRPQDSPQLKSGLAYAPRTKANHQERTSVSKSRSAFIRGAGNELGNHMPVFRRVIMKTRVYESDMSGEVKFGEPCFLAMFGNTETNPTTCDSFHQRNLAVPHRSTCYCGVRKSQDPSLSFFARAIIMGPFCVPVFSIELVFSCSPSTHYSYHKRAGKKLRVHHGGYRSSKEK